MKKALLRTKIRELIAKDEIENAIKLLTVSFQKSEQIDHLILQAGKYVALKKDQREGVIDYDKAQRAWNKLRKDILEFSNEKIDKEFLTEEKNKLSELKIQYRLSVARLAVLKVLNSLEDGETITRIYQLSQLKNRKFVVQVLQELEEVNFVEKTKIDKLVYWKLSKEGISFAELVK